MSANNNEYPEEILFRDIYSPTFPLSRLMEENKDLVANRRVKNNPEAWYYSDGKKKLKDETLLGITVLGCSVNLLGGLFKDEYFKYDPTEMGLEKNWEVEKGSPKLGEDYKFHDDSEAVYFQLSEIDKLLIPYCCQITSKEEYEKFSENSQKIIEEKGIKVDGVVIGEFQKSTKDVSTHARVEVNHHPTCMNYWHLQFDLFRLIDNTEVFEKTSNYRRINSHLRTALASIIHEKPTEIYNIPQEIYLK